ncbi:MAG: DUF3237 domain-containing protein [Ottowia sp.]|nr:DUF3237 domain-containing protein [Ottowia sp.]
MVKLIYEAEMRANLRADEIGRGPFGQRLIFNVIDGSVVGERLSGAIIGAGADWVLLGDDGFGRLDVRLTIQTIDGAHIYVQYNGLIQVTPAVGAVLGGGDTSTEYGDQYFFTNPRLEAGDERYGWVNQTVFLAEGKVAPGPAVVYRVYRVVNG